MQTRFLIKAWRALRAGRVGDAAAYKAATIGARAYPDIEAQLKALTVPLPHIDLAALRQLPPGTLGRVYADHMDCKGLVPLVVSPPVAAELAEADFVGIRYAVLHDAFHVLLGFDTDLAGELGVWSFVSGQHYSPSFQRAGFLARLLYTLVAPLKYRQLKAARESGTRMAAEAACLLIQPVQDFWEEPLTVVRQRLQIRP